MHSGFTRTAEKGLILSLKSSKNIRQNLTLEGVCTFEGVLSLKPSPSSQPSRASGEFNRDLFRKATVASPARFDDLAKVIGRHRGRSLESAAAQRDSWSNGLA